MTPTSLRLYREQSRGLSRGPAGSRRRFPAGWPSNIYEQIAQDFKGWFPHVSDDALQAKVVQVFHPTFPGGKHTPGDRPPVFEAVRFDVRMRVWLPASYYREVTHLASWRFHAGESLHGPDRRPWPELTVTLEIDTTVYCASNFAQYREFGSFLGEAETQVKEVWDLPYPPLGQICTAALGEYHNTRLAFVYGYTSLPAASELPMSEQHDRNIRYQTSDPMQIRELCAPGYQAHVFCPACGIAAAPGETPQTCPSCREIQTGQRMWEQDEGPYGRYVFPSGFAAADPDGFGSIPPTARYLEYQKWAECKLGLHRTQPELSPVNRREVLLD